MDRGLKDESSYKFQLKFLSRSSDIMTIIKRNHNHLIEMISLR